LEVSGRINTLHLTTTMILIIRTLIQQPDYRWSIIPGLINYN
jgi:hypothetical protein